MVVASGFLLLALLHVAFWMALPLVVTGVVHLRECWRPARPAAWAGLAGAAIGFGMAALAVVAHVLILRFMGPGAASGDGASAMALGTAGLLVTLGAGVPALVVLGYVLGFFLNRRRTRPNLPA